MPRLVRTHRWPVRLCHWSNVPVLAGMTWSGIAISRGEEPYHLRIAGRNLLTLFSQDFYREYNFPEIPTAIGWHPSEKAQHGAAQLDAWRTIQRAHAIANGVYVAAVNRVGFEGPPDQGIEFWGSSFVADPFGQVIAQASSDKEEILIADCDPSRMDEVRRNWPFLRDRRIDAYAPILERWLG